MAERPAPTETTAQTARHGRPWYAFGVAVPIGALGGLIGLGGAEFRLPVLAGPLGYLARGAVALNVAISLITVLASLAIRGGTLTFAPIAPLILPMGAMIAGALVTAFIGTSLVGRLSNEQLEQVILVFLVTIGGLLIIEPQSRQYRVAPWHLGSRPHAAYQGFAGTPRGHGSYRSRRCRSRVAVSSRSPWLSPSTSLLLPTSAGTRTKPIALGDLGE